MSFADRLENMVHNVIEDNFIEWPHTLDKFFYDVEKPLYLGCTKLHDYLLC